MAKKIGIVANAAFNIFNFRLGLMKFLRDKGYEVVAISPVDAYAEKISAEGFKYIPVKNLARKGTNPLQDFLLMNELRSIYQKEKIDVALQYTIKPNIYGTLAASFSGTKTICTVTGLGYTFLNKSLASTVARNLYKLAFRFADKVLFQNSDDRAVFIGLNLTEAGKTAIVPGSGIDTRKFNPGFCTEKHDQNTNFLMVTRLLKDKGIYEYATAASTIASLYSNIRFHLAGDIDPDNPSSITRDELQKWIDENIIVYHGYVQDTRTVICQSDCVVLPSYREGMPRVILEAMAMGKPCITTDAPGCKDAITAECGFLTKTADADSLITQMLAFFDLSQSKRDQMGKAARMRAEQVFEEKLIYLKYLEIVLNF
jgi:glycosyltransferase involved in cell wall biosynthesis